MKRSLWPWFISGFLTTFIGLALFKTVYFMAPSGQAVIRTRLWRFYVIEAPDFFSSPTQALGPATVNAEAFLNFSCVHLGVSVVGGTAVLVMAMLYRRLFRSATTTE